MTKMFLIVDTHTVAAKTPTLREHPDFFFKFHVAVLFNC